MSAPIISVENIGKDYVIAHQGDGGSYRTLRDTISGWFQKRNQPAPGGSEIFSALNDVSFEVQQGEVLGIIGRNGAGKSTLLKILSRITEPTRGRVRLRGRVASLLEVGTGFHPELTGRENIFLNGAILGMSRAEIRKKFDEIVDFSGVEKFLDTPVKRYSSGMYVRLAFAVAAHLEPEILIIDEVLAVGDTEFQKKCLGKMEQVAGQGRTVLFVSHNLVSVEHLCSSCMLLKNGAISASGRPSYVIDQYLHQTNVPSSWKPDYTHQSGHLNIESADLLVEDQEATIVSTGDEVTFRVHYRCDDPLAYPDGVECGFIIHGQGQKLVNLWSQCGLGKTLKVEHAGIFACTIPSWPFRTMPFTVEIHLNYQRQTIVLAKNALRFDSMDADIYGSGTLPHAGEGIVLLPQSWSHLAASD
jgi:lipopolysaccharide transport system ATP-binding protein